MDKTEDLSARFIMGNILSTEVPRTPMIRSGTQAQSTRGIRRSSRLSGRDADAQTPTDMVRRSMRKRINQGIIRKSQPPPRTSSFVLRKTRSSTSMLFDDKETPRAILKNILLTEHVKSPVVHEKAASVEAEPLSAYSSTSRTRPSIELSDLDLPDLTVGNVVSTAKGLSRKRPRRSLNVTAFEKRLRVADEAEEKSEESNDEISSLSLSSLTSLSLKTPFVDIGTERKGLQRNVSKRPKITEEEFGAAVIKRQTIGATSHPLVNQDLDEITHGEGFSLGLSKLSEPDLTTDIFHCNTALYPHTEAMTSNFSIIATQDKPTVGASQIQKDLETREEPMIEQRSELRSRTPVYSVPSQEGVVAECSSEYQPQDDVESQEEEEEKASELHVIAPLVQSEEGEVEVESHTDAIVSEDESNKVEIQFEEEGEYTDSQLEDEASLKPAEEENVLDCNAEEEKEEAEATETTEHSDSQEEIEAGSIREEEEELADSQESAMEAVEAPSVFKEDEDAAVYQTFDQQPSTSHSKLDHGAASQFVAVSSSAEETADEAEHLSEVCPLSSQSPVMRETGSQSEVDEDLSRINKDDNGETKVQRSERLDSNLEQLSKRSSRSVGALVVPAVQEEHLDHSRGEGLSEVRSKVNLTKDLHSNLEMEGDENMVEFQTLEQRDAAENEAEADADEPIPRDFSSEEDAAAVQGASEQEEQVSDDEDEDDDIPSKTPAFVRAKINFFLPDPSDSPTVLKSNPASSTTEVVPAVKPKRAKQVRKRPMEKKTLPKSYLMAVFKHFAKTKVAADVYPVLDDIMDKFFDRLAEDLEVYATHAKRMTIEVEDVVLLLKRQGYVNDKVPVEVLIEKYLRMDQRKLLIPIATSGNVVLPKMRK